MSLGMFIKDLIMNPFMAVWTLNSVHPPILQR